MKSPQQAGLDPERWTALRADDTPQGAAGVALRRARDATASRPDDVARLNARRAEHSLGPPPRPWHWRLALAALLLLATGGVVGAAGLLLRRTHRAALSREPRPVAGVIQSPSVRPTRPRALARATEQPPAEVSLELPAAPSQPPASQPAPVESRRPTLAAPARPTRNSAQHPAPPTEAGLLAGAFRDLRANQDAAAALLALDGYDRQFPGGELATEARVARVEALMALGRRAEALTLLETFDGTQAPPTRNVLIMRGELLAEAGQCPRAERDFDGILRGDARGDAEARALFGRGACRLRAGDGAAGEADLRRYLALYPRGTFAAAAREALSP